MTPTFARRRALIASTAAVVTLLSLSCGGGDGSVAPPPPQPGTLVVTLTTPNTDDRALRLTISGGTVTAVEAGTAGLLVLDRVTSSGTMLVVIGPIRSGAVARLQVPDVHQAANYHVTLQEVADTRYGLRVGSLGGYKLTVAP
jgi:hypothetical protein